MQRKFTARKNITVYLEESEYKWVLLQANGGSASEWLRSLILSMMEPEEITETLEGTNAKLEEFDAAKVPEVREVSHKQDVVPKNPKKERACEHGRPAGYNCWQCGGVAKAL